ncbi:MAG TPA: c-type cytochrome, partial [Candidatus Eisenbacteria bacterium]
MPRPSLRSSLILAGVLVTRISLQAALATSQTPAGTPPGGPPPPPPPPQNLQFYPKDMPRPELIARMREFSFALGVGCEYCHVDEHEGPNPREDFATDEKPAKVKARAMLVMTKEINDDLMDKIPHRVTPGVNVSCATCHHGLPVPQTLTERLTAAAAAGGADSVDADLTMLHTE